MRRLMSLVLAFALTLSLAAPALAASTTSYIFDDVMANEWYFDTVYECARRGLVQGVSATKFAPEKELTYAELSTIVTNAIGVDLASPDADGHWYDGSMSFCEYHGFVDADVDPEATVTREAAADFLYKSYEYCLDENAATDSFVDSGAVSSEYKDAVEHMYGNGLIVGTTASGRFNPQDALNRAEICAILLRTSEKQEEYIASGGEIPSDLKELPPEDAAKKAAEDEAARLAAEEAARLAAEEAAKKAAEEEKPFYTPSSSSSSAAYVLDARVSTQPDKTTYYAGEDFDATGMALSIVMSDGSRKDVTTFTVVNGENLTKLSIPVIVKAEYGGRTYTVNVPITVIGDIVPELPVMTAELTYTGGVLTPVFRGYNAELLDISGDTEATAVGAYTTTFTPKENVKWWDGSTEPRTVGWAVLCSPLDSILPAYRDTLAYNGSAQAPTSASDWDNYDPVKLSLSVEAHTDAGTYTAAFTPTANYMWADGSRDTREQSWRIRPKQVEIPVLPDSKKTVTYDAQAHDFAAADFEGFTDGEVVFAENTPRTAAGAYTVTLALANDTNYVWADGTNAPIDYGWAIERTAVVLTAPAIGELTYTGAAQQLLPSPVTADIAGVAVKYSLDETNWVEDYTALTGTDAGTYTVYYAADSTADLDGAAGHVDVIIKKQPVAKPAVTATEFEYALNTTHALEISAIDATVIGQSGDAAADAAGEYAVTFTLLHPENYVWDDDDTAAAYTVQWKVLAKLFPKPTATEGTELSYTYAAGVTRTIPLTGVAAEYMAQSGTDSAGNVGNYTITVSLNDTVNTAWDDGSIDDVTIAWSISKQLLAVPVAAETAFTYDGSEQALAITGYDAATMDVSGTLSATNAGDYSVTYALKDAANYGWEGTSESSFTIAWSIAKAQLTKPAASGVTAFNYDGNEKALSISGFDVSTMAVSGNTATDAGDYAAVVSIRDADNYEWTDTHNAAAVELAWNILKAQATIQPMTGKSSLTYNGAAQQLLALGASANLSSMANDAVLAELAGAMYYTIDGEGHYSAYADVAATDAKTYTVKVIVPETANYEGAEASVEVTISPMPVAKPAVSGESTFTFDGTEHELAFSGFDAVKMAVSGNAATNAGDYTAAVSLSSSNYIWDDDTTATVEFPWSISKATLTFASAPVAADGLVYTGAPLPLLTDGATVEQAFFTGAVEYTLTPDDEDSWTAELAAVTGTNAKTDYKVYYRVAEGDNWEALSGETGEIAIAKARRSDLTFAIGTATKHAYYATAAQEELDGVAVAADTVVPDTDPAATVWAEAVADTSPLTLTFFKDGTGDEAAYVDEATFTFSYNADSTDADPVVTVSDDAKAEVSVEKLGDGQYRVTVRTPYELDDEGEHVAVLDGEDNVLTYKRIHKHADALKIIVSIAESENYLAYGETEATEDLDFVQLNARFPYTWAKYNVDFPVYYDSDSVYQYGANTLYQSGDSNSVRLNFITCNRNLKVIVQHGAYGSSFSYTGDSTSSTLVGSLQWSFVGYASRFGTMNENSKIYAYLTDLSTYSVSEHSNYYDMQVEYYNRAYTAPVKGSFVEYVFSENPNAHVASSTTNHIESDGYWYEYQD